MAKKKIDHIRLFASQHPDLSPEELATRIANEFFVRVTLRETLTGWKLKISKAGSSPTLGNYRARSTVYGYITLTKS